MKKIFAITVSLLWLITGIYAQTPAADSMTREQFIHSQTVKSDTLNQKALALAVPDASKEDLNNAIKLIMSGLHTYAKFRDSVGLRETFDHLALVYHLQKKYVQAKWFYIQSNTFARDMKDTANIIQSLISLSTVKTDIKDYDLAARDLHEASSLAKAIHGVDKQIDAEQALADFYGKTGDDKRAAIATSRIAFLKDSVLKANEPKKPLQIAKVPVKPTAKPLAEQKTNYNMLITIIVIAVFALFIILYWRKKRGSNIPQ